MGDFPHNNRCFFIVGLDKEESLTVPSLTFFKDIFQLAKSRKKFCIVVTPV